MSLQSVGQAVFGFLGSLPVCVEVREEQLSTDAGLLPVRQFDEQLGWTAGFASQIQDGRQGCTHAVVEMVRQRVFGILADQYLVRVITCAENDLVVFPVLLHGTAHAALGVVPDLQRVVARLKQEWPDVQIRVRADSGYAVPAFYLACEQMQRLIFPATRSFPPRVPSAPRG